MKNELLSIGPFTIYGYGLMIGIGIVAAYLVTEYRAKKKGLDAEPVFGLTIFSVIGGFLGSKLLYICTRIGDIVQDPSVLKEAASGWVVYGGIIGGILTAVVYCRVKKMEFLKYLDVALPSVALAQGFGRIGCFLAGCCYGMRTESWCSVTFTNSAYAPNGVPLVPTQLISSALDFLLFAVLLLLSRYLRTPGQVSSFYLIFYSIGRFILEFFRGDMIRGSVGGLSTSQFISIFTGLAGVLLLVGTAKLHKKPKAKVCAAETEAENEAKEDEANQM